MYYFTYNDTMITIRIWRLIKYSNLINSLYSKFISCFNNIFSQIIFISRVQSRIRNDHNCSFFFFFCVEAIPQPFFIFLDFNFLKSVWTSSQFELGQVSGDSRKWRYCRHGLILHFCQFKDYFCIIFTNWLTIMF